MYLMCILLWLVKVFFLLNKEELFISKWENG